MAMTNKIPASVEAPASFGGLQLRVAVLCGLIQTLDGYDLSAIGLAVPTLELTTKNATEASGTTSGNSLDTCLDYSLTI